jgi:uncharacterized protein with FMN-binding domain
MKKILLPLIFIGVSCVYVFSRSPSSAFAGLPGATVPVTIPVTVPDTATTAPIAIVDTPSGPNVAELAATLAALQTRLAKLESAKKVTSKAPTAINAPALPTLPVGTPTSDVGAAPVTAPTPAPVPVVSSPAPIVVIPPPPIGVTNTAPAPASTPVVTTPNPTSPSATQGTAPAPAPTTPATGNVGIGTAGTYTGSVAQAGSRGPVQVRVTIAGGKISSVSFISYPNAASESIAINTKAMPKLI